MLYSKLTQQPKNIMAEQNSKITSLQGKRKRDEEDESPGLDSNKRHRQSFILVYVKGKRHLIEIENTKESLGSLIKSQPNIFGSLLPGDFVNSSKSLKFIDSTTNLAKWNKKTLTAHTPVSALKQLVPVYFIIFHHWYILVPRMMTVGIFKHKLKRFLKQKIYDRGQILYHTDPEDLPQVPNSTNNPIKDFRFNIKNSPKGKILEIIVDTDPKTPLDPLLPLAQVLNKTTPNSLNSLNSDVQKIVELWDEKTSQTEVDDLINYLEDSTCRRSDLDFSKAPITEYPFKMMNCHTKKVLQLWDDTMTLENTGVEDNCVVLFEGDRTTATSPNFRLYFNDYQKVVFPRETSWDQFESIIEPLIRPLIGDDKVRSDDGDLSVGYVVVKKALEGSWPPIVKQLNYSIELKYQLESRDSIFAVTQHQLPKDASGDHILYLKISDKSLLMLKVDPELTVSNLMKHLNIKEAEETHPCDLFWGNHNNSKTIDTHTMKCKDIDANRILKFTQITQTKKLKIMVFTPEFNFQDFELLATEQKEELPQSLGDMKWKDFKAKYLELLKAKFNFVPPSSSKLIYRYSQRNQDSWSTISKKNQTLLQTSLRNRLNTVYFSLKVPIKILESRLTEYPQVQVFWGMHHSINQAIRYGTSNRFKSHRLCVEVDSELKKYEPILKHLPVLHFIDKLLIPFSYLIVNGEKLLCPHFQSVQKTTNLQSFTIVNNKGIELQWTTESPYQHIYPESWLPPPNDEITNKYDKASVWGPMMYNFTIDRVSMNEFNLTFFAHTPDSLPFNPNFRISMRSIYSKKAPKIFSRDATTNHQKRWYYSKATSNWKPSQTNLFEIVELAEIIKKGSWEKHQEELDKVKEIEQGKIFKQRCLNFLKRSQKLIQSNPQQKEEIMIERKFIFEEMQKDYFNLPFWGRIRAEKRLRIVQHFLGVPLSKAY